MSALVVADRARDVVLVEGADAGVFLHSQLAADVVSVPVAGSAHSLLLEPTGHVTALVRVVRHGAETWTLDVEAGFGQSVIDRLVRYVLRSKVTMTLSDWQVRGWRGAGAWEMFEGVTGRAIPAWGAPDEVDVVAPRAVLDGVNLAAELTDPAHLEMLRVDARWPAFGIDLLAGDVPATSGVVRAAVSFTKGCYPGQELVERMDSRGSQAPVQVRVFSREGLGVGSRVTEDGRDVGTVTSVGCRLALARVGRGTSVGQPLADD